MITALLSMLVVICAIGWFARYVSCTAMIYYMHIKGYILPNDDEMKECTQYVVKNLFKTNRVEP